MEVRGAVLKVVTGGYAAANRQLIAQQGAEATLSDTGATCLAGTFVIMQVIESSCHTGTWPARLFDC
jgi:hypothetical protein